MRLDGVTPNEHIADPPGISEPVGFNPDEFSGPKATEQVLSSAKGIGTGGTLCYLCLIPQSASPAGGDNPVSEVVRGLEKSAEKAPVQR